MTRRILIAGGGLTGLAAAYYLQKRATAAGESLAITVAERAQRLGGQVQTERVEGLLVEEAPDSFLVRKPWFAQLARELGLELVGMNPEVKRTYILNNGELEPIPSGMQLFIPTNIRAFARSRLLSQAGRMRALLEPYIPVREADGDESLGHFVARRFGREMLEKIGGPLIAGVYGGHPYELSLMATFPQFLKMEREKGSLLRAARKAAPAQGTTGSAFQTVKGGLYAVIEALVKATPTVRVRTGAAVTEVSPGTDGTGFTVSLEQGERMEADAVVLTLPAYGTADLVAPFLPALAAELNAIPYASVVVAALAYARHEVMHPLDATGFLAPAGEGLPISGSTWVSTKWPHIQTTERVLLRAYLGGESARDWTQESDETILGAVRDSFARVMGLTAEPAFHRVFRWPRSRPRFQVGHLERVDRIEALARQVPGLHLAGAAYRGQGLPDCVKSGADAAERIAQQFGW